MSLKTLLLMLIALVMLLVSPAKALTELDKWFQKISVLENKALLSCQDKNCISKSVIDSIVDHASSESQHVPFLFLSFLSRAALFLQPMFLLFIYFFI